MSRAEIVVTGRGVVTGLGDDPEQLWDALMRGECGVDTVERTNPAWYRNPRAYEVKAQDPLVADRADLGRASSLMLRAGRAAWREAGLADALEYPTDRCGVVVGSALLDLRTLEAAVDGGQPPKDFLATFAMAATMARDLALEGPSATFANACGSGGLAVALAADWLDLGRVDCVLALGADTITESMYGLADRANLRRPERCAPFHRRAGGPLLAEGAAALVLERAPGAKRRGARVRGRILGAGVRCDASSMHAPCANGISATISEALLRSGIRADEIDYVCAHGTGTDANDRAETIALKQALGARAREVPVTSLKGMLGHASGASTAIAILVTLSAIEKGWVPQTLNLDAPGEGLDLDYVPDRPRAHPVNVALVNGFGFGGTNASVVVAAPRGPEA